MVDLTKAPFNLNEKDIEWVNKTINEMTLEEKIGQLFFLMGFTSKKKVLGKTLKNVYPGGMMYRPAGQKKVADVHRFLQENSKIPMLLAANFEKGGDGLVKEGTIVAPEMLVAATANEKNAYKVGEVCAVEGASVGANMSFAPILDINYNFLNPIANTRCYGEDADLVAKMGREYVKACLDNNFSVTIKHFPGDGVDARDQHLVTTHNTLEYEEWMDSFGKAYKESIEIGANGLMAGHIGLPKYMKEKHPDKPEYEFMPATLNPYILNDLLRVELGYNGLTMTDASLMTGFGQHGRREDLVPQAIAAGCDMFLFTRLPEDDYAHMLNGYKKGIITNERLQEALERILGLKASLGLHKKSIEQLVPNAFKSVDLMAHKKVALDIADQGITLIKDEQNILPLKPAKYKKIGIMYNGNDASFKAMLGNMPGIKGAVMRKLIPNEEKPNSKLVKELKKYGFDAFLYSFDDLLAVMKENNKTMKEWSDQFDCIIFLAKWETMSNQTSLQLQYKAQGFDAPWWVKEVPTILVSMGNPYHQFDLAMIDTVINCYAATDQVIEMVAKKLAGKSGFKGISPVDLSDMQARGEFKDYK